MTPPPVGLPPHDAFVPLAQEAGPSPHLPVVDEQQAPVLRLRGVCVGYPRHTPLLAHVDLDVRPGEVIGMVGVSGTGKTSLLKTIAGILPPRKGSVELLGRKAPRRPPRGTIGYIPQRLGLVTHSNVLDNVLLGTLHREPTWRSALHLPSARTLQQAHDVLDRVGLAHKMEEPVKELSGGQQRRVAVARALLQRPRILLADEFLSELDRATAEVVQDAVLELATVHDTAIILVEHHVRKARHMAHRVLEVQAGLLETLPEPPHPPAPSMPAVTASPVNGVA